MIPEVLVNTNLFVDGISFSGDVPSMTLPKIVVKTDEYRGGGMGGSIEMDMAWRRWRPASSRPASAASP